MHWSLTIFLCASMFLPSLAQSPHLQLSEEEIQEIIQSPEKVSVKIKELTAISKIAYSLPDQISILQTIVLLEPYSYGNECELSMVYARIAELMMEMDATEDALLLCHKTLNLARQCKELPAAPIYNHLGRLATFHMRVGNLDSSLFYFRQAKSFADTISEPIWYASALNNLGMVWTEIGQPDSAFSYYNRAIFGLNTANPVHKRFMGSVNDNLAQWHQKKGNHEVALQFYEENIALNRSFADTPAVVHAMLGYGEEQLVTGQLKAAKTTLDSIDRWLAPFESHKVLKAKLMFETSTLKKQILLVQNDFKGALQAADDALFWQNATNTIAQHTRKVMIGALNHSEIARINQELMLRNRLSQLEEQSSERQIYTLGIVIMLLLVIAYQRYLIKRAKKKKKKKKK